MTAKKRSPSKATRKTATEAVAPPSSSTDSPTPTQTVARKLSLPPAVRASSVPTDDAPEGQTVADPPPVGGRHERPLGQCANCTRPAVVRTNFSYAAAVSYCGVCLPEQYRFLLGG